MWYIVSWLLLWFHKMPVLPFSKGILKMVISGWIKLKLRHDSCIQYSTFIDMAGVLIFTCISMYLKKEKIVKIYIVSERFDRQPSLDQSYDLQFTQKTKKCQVDGCFFVLISPSLPHSMTTFPPTNNTRWQHRYKMTHTHNIILPVTLS